MSDPPKAKLVIQMSGAPGSGKSTVARLLRPRVNGVIVDHDVLRSQLLVSAAGAQFDDAAKLAYALQWALTRDLMAQGVDAVIIDSTCNYTEVLNQGSSLAAEYGYRYWYVECKGPDVEMLDRRLRERTPMPSQRSAVDAPPAAAQGNGARVGEDARIVFAQWIENPCRPHDSSRVIVVDSTTEPNTLPAIICTRLQEPEPRS